MTNATFTITSVEDKGTQIKIKDEKGNSWTFFKIKKDGNQTKAWQQFQAMKVGETTGVGYNETPNTKYGGVFRNIVNFTPPNYAQAAKTSLPIGAYIQTAPQPTYSPVKEDKATDWDAIAVGKCQTVFLEAYIQSGHSFMEAKLQVVQARQLAELVVYGKQVTNPQPEPVQEPQQITDEEVAKIPF